MGKNSSGIGGPVIPDSPVVKKLKQNLKKQNVEKSHQCSQGLDSMTIG